MNLQFSDPLGAGAVMGLSEATSYVHMAFETGELYVGVTPGQGTLTIVGVEGDRVEFTVDAVHMVTQNPNDDSTFTVHGSGVMRLPSP